MIHRYTTACKYLGPDCTDQDIVRFCDYVETHHWHFTEDDVRHDVNDSELSDHYGGFGTEAYAAFLTRACSGPTFSAKGQEWNEEVDPRETYLMNVNTGSVDTEDGWWEDYQRMDAEEWGSEEFNPDGDLVQVALDASGHWVTVEDYM